MPPQGADTGVLWERFAGLLGVDPGGVDLTRARANSSLGLPEIEFLRRLNQALPAEVPDWFYMWNVKEGVAHRALAARPRRGAWCCPPTGRPGPRSRRSLLICRAARSGYDIRGDLDELARRRPG